MANPEHVVIVNAGTRAILEWRQKRPDATLDLSGVDLTGIVLREAELRQANLSQANLMNANLKMANMFEVNLRDADLSGTNLIGANLNEADLTRTTLQDAMLFGCKLYRVNFDQTDFTDSMLGISLFADVDLSKAVGLENAVHKEKSTIGVDTLFKSKGRIPPKFLRGCGVPEVLIEYLPTFINSMEPIQFYSCFINHSSKDEQFAKKLHYHLEDKKLRVWFAPEDMRGGKKFWSQIDEAIRMYDRLLVVLSENSMCSEWVKNEIKRARKKEKETGMNVLFPIALVPFKEILAWECLDSDTGEDLAVKVREYHIPDFSNWKHDDDFDKGFDSLMRDLRREAK